MNIKLLNLFFLGFTTLFFAQNQIGTPINGNAGGGRFGASVALNADGTIFASGAPFSDYVKVYENIAGTWTQIGSDITAEASDDFFGVDVSLNADGSILAVGATTNDGNGSDAGHVRVYENTGGIWTQIGNDIDGEASGDFSGEAVSLSANGNILAIGAGTNDGSGNNAGHVRVYENIGGTWIQIGNDINGEASGDFSGRAVSLSADGTTVAIGATENISNGARPGQVRVYQNNAGNWVQVGQDIDGEATGDDFGNAVSINSNGSVVAIAANRNDGNGNFSGHVRVYENISGTWTQIGNDIDGEAGGDFSGFSVSINATGNVVAIGAPENDNPNGSGSGHVRVYQNISGTWTQMGIDIDGLVGGDEFGQSVSLSADGTILAVGADDSGGNSGQVRLFDLSAILSIDEFVSLNSTIKVFPNPATDRVQIEGYNASKIRLYDINGRLVTENFDSNTLDLQNIPTGIYILKIISHNNTTDTKKLIIK